MPYNDDNEWVEDKDPYADEEETDEAVSEHESEASEDATDDLLEAQARLTAKDRAAEDSANLELQIARAKSGAQPAELSDEAPTALTMTLDSIPLGDPKFNELVEELRYIANERKAMAEARAAAAAATPDPETPSLAFDAGLLPKATWNALQIAAKGGSRETPPGMPTAEWVSLLAAAGVR